MTTLARVDVDDWIEVSEAGAALVVRLVGELDVVSRASTEAAVLTAIMSAGAAIIDLEAVTFCDSSGVAMFITIARTAEARAIRLTLRNIPSNVRRIFEIANLDREIEVGTGHFCDEWQVAGGKPVR